MENTNENTPASEVPWPHPGYADLADWCTEQGYIALYMTYDTQLRLWHDAGRPTEGFESKLWTKEEALF